MHAHPACLCAFAIMFGLGGHYSLIAQSEDTDEDSDVSLITLSPFEVVAQKNRGYRATGATGVMRTATPLLEVPQTVNIITEELFEDLQAYSIGDALYYSSNINRRLNSDDGFRIRGFRVLQRFRNGFEDQAGILVGANTKDSASISRVEIIKGTNAVMLQNADPGGSVNRITKKPLFDDRLLKTTFTVGSDNLFRFHADAGGPLNEAESLAYRLNVASTEWDHFQKHKGPNGTDALPLRRFFVAPSFQWKINSKMSLLLDFEYEDQDRFKEIRTIGYRPGDGSIVFIGDNEQNFAQPWAFKEGESYDVFASLDIQLLDKLNFRQRFAHGRYEYFEMFDQARRLQDVDGDGIPEELSRFVRFTDSWNRFVELQGDLVAELTVGGIVNTFLFNYNWRNLESKSSAGRNFDVPNVVFDDPSTFFVIPQPNRNELGPDNFPDRRSNNPHEDNERWSWTVQDQFSFWEGRIHGVAGVRFDKIQGQEGTTSAPRYGVVFQPKPNLSLYYSFADSERAQRRVRPEDGVVLDKPIKGFQHEAGIKAELFEGKMSASFAYYIIVRENLILGVLQPDGTQLLEHAGEQTSEGIEFELNGLITDNWQFLLSAGTADTNDKSTATTKALRGTMDYRVSLWTVYDVTEGPLEGLSIGGGWIFNGEMVGDREGSYHVPATNVGELRLGYRFNDHYRISLNVKNITDNDWWEDSLGDVFMSAGTPRAYQLAFTVDW